MKYLPLGALFCSLLISCSGAKVLSPSPVETESHEYAHLEKKTVNYRNWTYQAMPDGKPIQLRDMLVDKKLILLVYFAPWCGNWKNQMPLVTRLFQKYKSSGFDVIAISEYGSINEVRACIADNNIPYTVVIESESRELREKTAHFDYRRKTGDSRKWGSPWNVFVDAAQVEQSGDLVMDKAWVVNGELIETEVESFIRRQLGLAPLGE